MGSPNSKNQAKITIAIILMLLAVIIVTVIVVFVCGKNNSDNSNPINTSTPAPTSSTDPDQSDALPEYIVHTWIKDGTDIYEARVYSETKNKDYYINNKYESTLDKMSSLSIKAFSIEDFTGIDGSTLDASLLFDPTEMDTPTQPLTWKADMNYSTMYVHNLLANGWEISRQAVTPTYCEIYLHSGEKLKRVVIFKSSLMASDVSNDTLPDISTYFK